MSDNIQPNEFHVAMYAELIGVLRKYLSDVTAEEVLAVTSNLVGKVMAMQNSATMPPERAMAILLRNVRIGNQEMVDALIALPVQGSA